MSEHLPECPAVDYTPVAALLSGVRCICGRLRTCRARTLDEARVALDEHIDNSRCCDGYEMNPEHALAAIDALKETA